MIGPNKPWEETWTLDEDGTNIHLGDRIIILCQDMRRAEERPAGSDLQELDETRAKFVLQAPKMAVYLLEAWERNKMFDADGLLYMPMASIEQVLRDAGVLP